MILFKITLTLALVMFNDIGFAAPSMTSDEPMTRL